jgi:putative hydrolase of the HAD superfamily
VIFDLWDTIVDFPAEASLALEREWAGLLGHDPDDFAERWRASRAHRDTGLTVAEAFRAIGVPEERLDEFVSMRRDFVRRGLAPRPGAVETLLELRRRGYALGLISVCSEDVPLVWQETAFAGLFDSTVFSATCRLRKPDPAIYRLALDELGVEPEEALFVGDGANDELAGAERVGMRAALIHRPREDPLWPEARAWSGPRITSVPEVLTLL